MKQKETIARRSAGLSCSAEREDPIDYVNMEPLLIMRPEGLYCPIGDFYIDPNRRVGRAIITHGHTDHLRPGHKRYLISKASEPILHYRLSHRPNSPPIQHQTLIYGEVLTVNGVHVSLHPAGHILGSAQVRLERRGYTAVVTGDYKLEADASCEEAQLLRCHLLVVESTFALPVYVWRPQNRLFEDMRRWSGRCLTDGVRPVFLCYSLGKAQRVLAGLRDLGPFHVHPAVQPFVEIYRAAGIELPTTTEIGEELAPTVVPPGGEASLAGCGPYRTALVSGWTAIGRRGRRGFALSDHLDWPALNQVVIETGAKEAWFVHGYSGEAARWFGEKGLATRAL